MKQEGPYVSVAAICDQILLEKDDRISCIRFLDTLNVGVNMQRPQKPSVVRVQVNAFIAFKSGAFIGTKNCMLRLVSPSGKAGLLAANSPPSYPMTFNGGEHGHNLMVTLDIPASESGLYWFDVTLDDEVYARIPLKINITWQSSPTPIAPESSENSSQV